MPPSSSPLLQELRSNRVLGLHGLERHIPPPPPRPSLLGILGRVIGGYYKGAAKAWNQGLRRRGGADSDSFPAILGPVISGIFVFAILPLVVLILVVSFFAHLTRPIVLLLLHIPALHALAHHLDGGRPQDDPVVIWNIGWMLLIATCLAWYSKTKLQDKCRISKSYDPELANVFGLFIGHATGEFAARNHGTAIKASSPITLRQRDAAKNFNIFGEVGTGKTTCVISPLVLQALEFDAGALIFDVRGDYAATVERLAMLAGKPIKRIGIGHLGVNLLEGLTPDTAAGFVHSALKLLGQGQGDSGFWVGMALNRCRAAFTILEHCGDPQKKEHFSLKGLYSFVFDPKFRERAIGMAAALRDEHPPESPVFRRLQNAISYEENNADKHEEKTSAGIKATIETALAQFADPDLEDAFCSSDGAKANIANVLDGTAFVVNVSRSNFKAAARIVYLLIKERFFQAVNTRADMPPCSRRDRPVFFFCDEYQQIASATDQDFFDTSRSLNAIGVVASQSIEAYYAAIGNRDTTTALLANFTNIITFRSTPATLEYVASRLGDTDRPKSKQVEEESVKDDWETTYQKRTIDEQERRRLVDPGLVRSLEPGKAIALLSVGGYAFDDVISLRQILDDDLPKPPTKAPTEPPPTVNAAAS